MDLTFKELTAEENVQITDAIPLITLLIGTADGFLDIRESEWAERVVKYRQFDNDESLKQYYKAVGRDFDDRLNHFIRLLPEDKSKVTASLVERLEKLNPVMKKLNAHDGHRLYEDFLSFARHVAKSNGGVFYMGSISPEEKALLDLSMIDAVAAADTGL